jgi:hypothetical protein
VGWQTYDLKKALGMLLGSDGLACWKLLPNPDSGAAIFAREDCLWEQNIVESSPRRGLGIGFPMTGETKSNHRPKIKLPDCSTHRQLHNEKNPGKNNKINKSDNVNPHTIIKWKKR